MNIAILIVGAEDYFDAIEDMLEVLGAYIGTDLREGADIVHADVNIMEDAGGGGFGEGASEGGKVVIRSADGVIIFSGGASVFRVLEEVW